MSKEERLRFERDQARGMFIVCGLLAKELSRLLGTPFSPDVEEVMREWDKDLHIMDAVENFAKGPTDG